MFSVAQGVVSSLPHATLITYWLRSVHNIKSKTPSQTIRTFLLYDHTTLNHMFFYDENTQTWNLKRTLQSSSSVNSDPSMSNNTHTPTVKNRPSVHIPDPPLFSPKSASSVKQSTSSIPVIPYTPTAPAYSPFASTSHAPFSTSPQHLEASPEPPSPPAKSPPPPQPAFSEPPSPQPTFRQPQSQPCYSLPSIDRFMESVMKKLDDLKSNTPSAISFKSACDQLFTSVAEAQISSNITLQRIEEKVDMYETKMKEYGHHTHDCMMQILNTQRSMMDNQRNMAAMQKRIFENQGAMKQLIINLTEAVVEVLPPPPPAAVIDVDAPASTSKKSPRKRGGR